MMKASHHRDRIWISSDAVHDAIDFQNGVESSSNSLPGSATKKKRRHKDEYTDWGWIRAALVQSTDDSWVVLIEDETSPLNGQQVEVLKDDTTDGVTTMGDGQTQKKNKNELVQMQNDFSTQEPPDDLITLTHLHEPALVYSLRRRFEKDSIYTHTGSILLALNPFKPIVSLYHKHVMNSYYSAIQSKREPHVYASADDAYRNMMRSLDFHYTSNGYKKNADQSILVSGESGAGKTVTTKHIMKYLAFLSQQRSSAVIGRGKPKKDSSSNRRPRSDRSDENEKEPWDNNTASADYQESWHRRIRKSTSTSAFPKDMNVHVERKILESNPILESFGNARTIRNDNSSRFGKFIQLQFNSKGYLVGASMETYLLEKVRLLSQSEGERNYHVFYMLLAALQSSDLPEDDGVDKRYAHFLKNYTAQDFFMTNQSGTYDRRDRVDDVEEFEQLENAMTLVGFEPEMQGQIFDVVCALLHSSNLTFHSISNDESCVERENPHFFPVMSLLGLEAETFNNALCSFSIEARGETHIRSLPKRKAEKGLEALIKAIYAALFRHIVFSINDVVTASESVSAYIAVLDIFGFETFKTNSFEQLCINYCNEALQQQFNKFVFKAEQEEYNREGIQWSFIEYPDNQDVLDLIDKKVSGIISILDDQCKAPGTTDKTFANDIYRKCKHHSRFEADFRQVGARRFAVVHFAGVVEYDTEGFVEKNRDELPREATFLLESSSNSFVKKLAKVHSESIKNSSQSSSSSRFSLVRAESAGKTEFNTNNSGLSSNGTDKSPFNRRSSFNSGSSSRSLNSSSRITVGGQFKNQLHSLRVRINQTCPHYIRCLKPNDLLIADDFNPTMIVEQLRYAGVLEAIRVSRVGFPQRYTHSQFIQRYCVLSISNVNAAIKKGFENDTICSQLVQTISDLLLENIETQLSCQEKKETNHIVKDTKKEINQSRFQIQMGKTKVFLRQEAFDQIEHMRLTKMENAVLHIQSSIRRYLVEKLYRTMRFGFIKLQSHVRRKSAIKRVQYLRETFASIIIQKNLRMIREVRYFNAIIYIANWSQKNHRANVIKTEYNQRRHEMKCIITIQCFVRVCASRTELKKLRVKARDLEAITKERDSLKMQLEQLKSEIQSIKDTNKNEGSIPKSIYNIESKNVAKEESDLSDTRSINKISAMKEELESTHLALLSVTTQYEENMVIMEEMKNELDQLRQSNSQQFKDSKCDEVSNTELCIVLKSEEKDSCEKSMLLQELESSQTALHDMREKYEDNLAKMKKMEKEFEHFRQSNSQQFKDSKCDEVSNTEPCIVLKSEEKDSCEKSMLLQELETSQTALNDMREKYEDNLAKMKKMEQELEHLNSISSQQSLHLPDPNLELSDKARQNAKKGEELEKESNSTKVKQGAFTCSFSKMLGPLFKGSKVSSTANRTFN